MTPPHHQMTQILASARHRPPPPPPLSSSVIGSVGSVEKLLSLGTVLRDPLPAIPRPLPASDSMLSYCFGFSFLYTLGGEEGDCWGAALQPPPPLALPSCSGPLREPSLAFTMGLALSWGAGDRVSAFPQKARLCRIKCNFQSENLFGGIRFL